MMVPFHNTECNNKGNKLKSWLLLLLLLIKSFSLRHRFNLWGCHVMNEKPEDSKGELINSLSDSYCSSHVMNERLEKNEDSKGELINSLSGSFCISHVMNERLEKHLRLLS